MHLNIQVYKEGGTQKVTLPDGEVIYVDKRVGTKTPRMIYDRYPGDPDSQMITGKRETEILGILFDSNYPHA